MSTCAPPLRKDGSGGSVSRRRGDCRNNRSAVSTSSDIVRPCRAASRLSLAMTVASILSVVFIWLTIQCLWRYVNSARPHATRRGTEPNASAPDLCRRARRAGSHRAQGIIDEDLLLRLLQAVAAFATRAFPSRV